MILKVLYNHIVEGIGRKILLPRIRVTISKEAQDSLMELQRRMNKSPAEVINELLVEQHKAIIDDELCEKEYFSSCVIYQIQMPFCFPYECEFFNFHSNFSANFSKI